jgi:hypothetical protein
VIEGPYVVQVTIRLRVAVGANSVLNHLITENHRGQHVKFFLGLFHLLHIQLILDISFLTFLFLLNLLQIWQRRIALLATQVYCHSF